jgi:hypothetical protein
MGVGATAMQRIRYGLTGLAFVFLMVLLGTAIIRSGEDPEANQSAATLPQQPHEPLAELGVAPGEGTDNGVDNQVESRGR